MAHRFAAEEGTTLPPDVLALFAKYDWPGNVRELRNAVTRVAVQPEAVVPSRSLRVGEPVRPLPEARRRANDAFEKRYLELVIAQAGGNISRAAELAGISRPAFTRLVARHGLRVRDRETTDPMDRA